LLVAGVAWLVVDAGKFLWWAHQYGLQAEQGLRQIPVPVSPDEAIVVLTGDHGRIPKALEVLRSRGSPLLIISGTRKGTTLTDLVNQQGDSTINIHENWNKIVLESRSGSTLENAEESANILEKYHVDRVILVTSEYHMYRAAVIFRMVAPGYDYIEYAVPSEVSDFGFAPTSHDLSAAWKLWIEYWKWFLFRLAGAHSVVPHPKK
jgi:uncharacterized SAM-binding protein YcdF (DUF218 family)